MDLNNVVLDLNPLESPPDLTIELGEKTYSIPILTVWDECGKCTFTPGSEEFIVELKPLLEELFGNQHNEKVELKLIQVKIVFATVGNWINNMYKKKLIP